MDAEMKLSAEKIVRDAPIQGIDFADPVYAFTVWTEFPSHFMKHSGSRKTLNDARVWALKHVNQKTLYIVRGPLDAFDITKIETVCVTSVSKVEPKSLPDEVHYEPEDPANKKCR